MNGTGQQGRIQKLVLGGADRGLSRRKRRSETPKALRGMSGQGLGLPPPQPTKGFGGAS